MRCRPVDGCPSAAPSAERYKLRQDRRALPASEEIRGPLPGNRAADLDAAALDEAGAESAASVFAYRPGHRWWYFPAMHAGEALIIKLHDTDHSVAWRAPHTSFHDASAAGASPRQSIELRSVAYFY